MTAFYLEAMPDNALSQVYGIVDELGACCPAAPRGSRGRCPRPGSTTSSSRATPTSAPRSSARFIGAGSDTIGLWPFPLDQSAEVLELTAREVLPQL